MFNRGREGEPRLVNGLYRVNLQGKTLGQLDKKNFSIFYYGDPARALKDKRGLQGEVTFYKGILPESFYQPWETQLEIMAREETKLRTETGQPWRLQPLDQAATMIEGAGQVLRKYGVNLLLLYSRFGDGSLVAGRFFNPRASASVSDDWAPLDRSCLVGLLPQAVLE